MTSVDMDKLSEGYKLVKRYCEETKSLCDACDACELIYDALDLASNDL